MTLVEMLKAINALCNNPHWTTDRRWRIEQLSRQALDLLEEKNRKGVKRGCCVNCGALKEDHIHYSGQPLRCPSITGGAWKEK